jgi:hypothetical protein
MIDSKSLQIEIITEISTTGTKYLNDFLIA